MNLGVKILRSSIISNGFTNWSVFCTHKINLINSYLLRFAHKDKRFTGKITTDADASFRSLTKNYPDLKKLQVDSLTNYFEFMSIHGFQPYQAAEMVLINSSLLRNYEQSIPKTLDAWRNLGYSLDDTTYILCQHPKLTDLAPSKLLLKFGFLGKYFSRKESLYTIESCYEVIGESTSILDEKLIYLIEELSHRPLLIAKSNTLAFSIKHIKSRHEFLIRAGIFIPVSYHKLHKKSYSIHPNLERPNYFSPKDIVCTNDIDFIKKCGNGVLTINEFAAFEEIYEKELDAENYLGGEDEEILNNDDDDDVDLEEFSGRIGISNSSSFFNKKDSADFYY